MMMFRLAPVLCLFAACSAFGADPQRPANERFAAADVQEVPSLQRHVLPVMGKMGCNGRACHGSFQGQGGFRLSLFGYDFKTDHAALLGKSSDGATPRVDLEDPGASLIVQKPTLTVPHKGGKRMDVDSWEYHLLVRWMEAGAKAVPETDVHFERLTVSPERLVFAKSGDTAQLKVFAHWSDGTSEDVTPLSRFRTNNEAITSISDAGLVQSVGPGDTHVVAFYDNGVVPVETLLPVSDQFGPRYPQVPTPTKIDQLVVQKLRDLGVVPSELTDDAEFLRRVSLDIIGTLPTPVEIQAFLDDQASDKRAKKIDQLLERPEYAAWWATKLCDLTGNNPNEFQERYGRVLMGQQWYDWIRKRVQDNMPYDELVARIVLATSRRPGQSYDDYVAEMATYFRKQDPADFTNHPDLPYFWERREFRNPDDTALIFAHTFLGVRLQCAQCHKHPFDQWTQEDFTKFRSFFTRVDYGVAQDARARHKELEKSVGKDNKRLITLMNDGGAYPWKELYVNPVERKPGKDKEKDKKPRGPAVSLSAKFLGGDEVELDAKQDPRENLMAWMREKDHPYFARAFVNRVWANYFGVGIIEPADDLNLANPPSNGPLLDYLTQEFVARKYDVKWLHRQIANSRTYQLGWKTNPTNRLDTRNFSHAQLRRLPAEVAFDSLQQAIARMNDDGTPECKLAERAIAQSATARNGKNKNTYALTVFGKPERKTACDCERSNEPSLLQTIYLLNDQETLSSLERSGWVQQIDKQLNPNSTKPNLTELTRKKEQLQGQIVKLKDRIEQRKKANKPEKEVKREEDRIAEVTKSLAAVEQKIAAETAPVIPAAKIPDQPPELVREAYLRTLSRLPTDAEAALAVQHLQAAPTRPVGLRDLLWALLNTKEFIVNH